MKTALIKIRRMTGDCLRQNFPVLYRYWLKIIDRGFSFYVLDYLGGSFKDYFCEENMKERIAELKKNLDTYSLQTVDVLIRRLLNYPEAHFKVRMKKANLQNVVGGLLQEETKANRSLVKKTLKKFSKQYVIAKSLMEPSVFYYHHGLVLVPEQVRDYVKGYDFIDCGAYNGDSALALYQYGYKKIYSIEMSKISLRQYICLMERNHIPPSKYELINVAIASRDDLPPFTLKDDTGASNLTISINNTKYVESLVNEHVIDDTVAGKILEYRQIQQISLDTLVKKYNMIPKFIKADIEGYSLELVKGATDVLRKYRPVLGICIYHNPHEFFEVKPFIESIVDDYTCMIRKLTVGPTIGGCHGEVTLIAYPNEILK
jgi:FkbM family methyltransferase